MRSLFFLSLVLSGFASLAQEVGTESVRIQAECQLEKPARKTMLQEFKLTLTSEQARIETNRGEYVGNLFTRTRKESSGVEASARHIQYVGFDNLLKEYEVSLVVSEKAFQKSENFEVRLVGRGDAYYTEDYNCVAE